MTVREAYARNESFKVEQSPAESYYLDVCSAAEDGYRRIRI